MFSNVFREGWNILQLNWLKIIGMVFFVYTIKLLLGTLPIQGTVIIRFDPLDILTSDSLGELVVQSFVNGVLFFILVQYITLTDRTMRGRFVKAITFPFRNFRLLYKGLIVLFLTYILLSLFGLVVLYSFFGLLIILSAGLDGNSILLAVIFALLYTLFIWLLTGISQALYILHDDPSINTFRSIGRSFGLMRRNRWTLIGLFVLTGIGVIIGVLLLLVGVVITMVLFEVFRLAFYRELLRKKRQHEWQHKVESAVNN